MNLGIKIHKEHKIDAATHFPRSCEHPSESRGTNSNSDCGLIRICTKEFEFLDWADFGGVALAVE